MADVSIGSTSGIFLTWKRPLSRRQNACFPDCLDSKFQITLNPNVGPVAGRNKLNQHV
jgi:hypothetical protein